MPEPIRLMFPSPSCQPRLFIVGLPRAERLDLAASFRDEGFDVRVFADLELATLAFGQHTPDAVLLGWSAESLGFVERFGGLTPVLLLSRHNVLIDVVRSLRAGAADYLRMPCYFPEILARVERSRTASPGDREVRLDDVAVSLETFAARVENHAFQMTEREARILAALIRCPNHPVSREALMRVAGVTTAKPTIIESYIKQLRKRHELLRRCVRTRYGRGYAFCR